MKSSGRGMCWTPNRVARARRQPRRYPPDGSTNRCFPISGHGDHVIVLNAAKFRLTAGRKTEGLSPAQRLSGGLTTVVAKKVRAVRPARMIYDAVRNASQDKLGKHMLRKLRVYPATSTPTRPDPGGPVLAK